MLQRDLNKTPSLVEEGIDPLFRGRRCLRTKINFKVGNSLLDTKDSPSTYIATATPFLAVDLETFPHIMRLLRYPSYDYDLDLYTLDCRRVSALPTLHFNVGTGFDFLAYDVSPQQYTAKVDTLYGSTCAVLIVEGEYGWALGTRFWPKQCATFSYDTGEMWFADPLKGH